MPIGHGQGDRRIATGSPEQLPQKTAELILDDTNEIAVSLASSWEIAIKQKLGKLSFPAPLSETFRAACVSGAFEILTIELSHIERTLALPLTHRDSFDRLIAAQALEEGLTLLSKDENMDAFGIPRVWE